MKVTTSVSLAFAVAIEALALFPCPCSALALINSSSPSTVTVRASSTNEAFHHVVTRRSAAFSVLSCVFAIPGLALAADELNVPVPVAVVAQEDVLESEAAKAEAAKERMRQRIAESKKSFRKPTDLVKQRKDTTDYSCVSDTGSPCAEGLVPRAVQREIVKALEKLEE